MTRLLSILFAFLLVGCGKKPAVFKPLDGTGTCLINADAWIRAQEGVGIFPKGEAKVLLARVAGWPLWHALAIYPDGKGIASWEYRDGFEVNHQLARDRQFWDNPRALAELWAAAALPPTEYITGAKFSTEVQWQ